MSLTPETIERLCVAWATLETIARQGGRLKEDYLTDQRARLVATAIAAYEVLWRDFLRYLPEELCQDPATRHIDGYMAEAILNGYLCNAGNGVRFSLHRGMPVGLSVADPDQPVFWTGPFATNPKLLEPWAKVLEGTYLPGIDPHQLNCACIDEKPVNVNGWVPSSYCGDEEACQQYEPVLPKSVNLTDEDVEGWTPEQCIRWLADHDFDSAAKDMIAAAPEVETGWLRGSDEGDDEFVQSLATTPPEGAGWEPGVRVTLGEDVEHYTKADWNEGPESCSSSSSWGAYCYDCRDAVVKSMDNARDQWLQSNEPAMSYYYPLTDSFNSEDVEKIEGLPLMCVYLVPQETFALVLTGGGMNFSTEIIEAHVRLGYYPPSHFRLPTMGGTLDRTKRTLIAAVRESNEIQKRWAEGRLDDLDRYALRLIK